MIDKVSCALAKKIETVCTRAEYSHFNREMIRRYCMLVQNYSFQKYTPLVRKAMNYIELNISQGVSLKNLSEELNVNASYLSTVFKKEMGQTVTEYINQRRVEIAILYLNCRIRKYKSYKKAAETKGFLLFFYIASQKNNNFPYFRQNFTYFFCEYMLECQHKEGRVNNRKGILKYHLP